MARMTDREKSLRRDAARVGRAVALSIRRALDCDVEAEHWGRLEARAGLAGTLDGNSVQWRHKADRWAEHAATMARQAARYARLSIEARS